MISEEVLRKYFEAIYKDDIEWQQVLNEPPMLGKKLDKAWKKFLANKNILDDYCVELVNEAVDNYVAIQNDRFRANNLKS